MNGVSGFFVPPYPERPKSRLPLPELLRRARRSFLEVWLDAHFEQEMIPTRLLARRILICNSPDSVQDAFIDQHAALERKSPQMRHALEPLLGDGLFISDGLVWKERRRVVAAVTHPSRLASLTPVMTEVAAEFREAWRARPAGQPLDLLAAMGQLAAEVICRTLFGRRLGGEAAATVVQAFARYQARIGHLDLFSVLGLPDWLPRRRGGVTAEVRQIHAVIEGLVQEAMQGGEASLIRAMAEAALPGSGRPMDATAFRNEAATLFMAGHETTANALAWAFYLLSQAPAAEARAVAEAGALGGRAATWEDLPRLPFLRAVVEETLRLYPPVPLLARQAQESITIAGHAVHPGDLVMVVPWLLHRHRRWWRWPDQFLPDRFLPGGPERPRHAYVPFSLGPRVCTGMGFGLAEAVIVLATLLPAFHLRLAPGARVFPVCRLTLRPGEALPMLLTPR
ncbi:cytochrome P450 [Roseicella frigidaeris]|uniref:cytochrome P450 n=1 Tax=Roseicella frigidaeris TaxID=2230885 RepID=UPI001FB38DD7|nr:cytochrome P450 [Roseicella frigidaeris]